VGHMGIGRHIFLGLMAGVLALAGYSALAQDMVLSGTATSMAEEQRALKDARAQANDAQTRSEALEAQAATATAEADKVRARIAALAARIQQTEANIREGQARIDILKRLQKQQAAHLAEKQAPAVRLIAAIQNVARRPSVYTLVQPGSVRDAVHVRAVLSTVMPVIEHRTAGLRADLTKSRQLRFAAETARQSRETGRTAGATAPHGSGTPHRRARVHIQRISGS
jgi:murein hydrolase activator